MNCNYKVKITDIQNKYQFKILCKGSANSINVNDIYNLLPTTTTEGDAFSIANTSDIKAKSISIKGNTSQASTPTPSSPVDVKVVTGTNTLTISNGDNTKTQTYTINLGTLELCKIGDYQDYLYKNNNKWYLHKEIIKIILSKTKNWAYYSITSGSLFRCSNALGNDKGDNRYVPFCSHYQGLSFYDSGTSRPNNNIYINSVNHNLDLVDNRFTSVDDFKTWLGNNEVVLYYPLSTPTDTEVTDATLIYQLNKILNNIRTYEGGTNISSTSAGANPIINITTFNKLS